jgi:hypothetical protein
MAARVPRGLRSRVRFFGTGLYHKPDGTRLDIGYPLGLVAPWAEPWTRLSGGRVHTRCGAELQGQKPRLMPPSGGAAGMPPAETEHIQGGSTPMFPVRLCVKEHRYSRHLHIQTITQHRNRVGAWQTRLALPALPAPLCYRWARCSAGRRRCHPAEPRAPNQSEIRRWSAHPRNFAGCWPDYQPASQRASERAIIIDLELRVRAAFSISSLVLSFPSWWSCLEA